MEDYKEVIRNHEEANILVMECLENDQRCRNDDMWLCLQVWIKQGIKINIDYDDLPKMFNPETIIRNRAFIQNDECLLLPTDPKVLIKRKMKENAIRSYYGNNGIFKEFQNIKYGIN